MRMKNGNGSEIEYWPIIIQNVRSFYSPSWGYYERRIYYIQGAFLALLTFFKAYKEEEPQLNLGFV